MFINCSALRLHSTDWTVRWGKDGFSQSQVFRFVILCVKFETFLTNYGSVFNERPRSFDYFVGILVFAAIRVVSTLVQNTSVLHGQTALR